MKKVKIIFTAAAIFAVVGSALAFKTSHKGTGNYFCIADGSSGTCPSSANFSDAGTDQFLYCNTTPGSPCVTQVHVTKVID